MNLIKVILELRSNLRLDRRVTIYTDIRWLYLIYINAIHLELTL